MKTFILPRAGLLLLVIIAGCTSVKRFKSAEYKGEDNALVDMNLFGSSLDQSAPEPPGRNLWDLSAGAQTQLIQILDDRYPENAAFIGALNQDYMQKSTGPFSDLTHSKLRMVFTISREKNYPFIGKGGRRFSPADRIESLEFSLTIPDHYNLSFTGWNRYATEYGELEIADVSFSRSLEISGDFSTAYVDGGIQSSSGRKEDQAVISRYLKLNGSISPRSIHMEAEGARGIDLAGNVIADVSLAFEGFPERVCFPVYRSTGEGAPPELSRLNMVDMIVPRIRDLPDAIMATLEMEYIYRHVESGWKSFQEWDDRVAYYSGTVRKEVQIFERRDYLPLFYVLGSDSETIRLRSSSGQEYPLQFMGHKEAQRFLEWLQDKAASSAAQDPLSQIKAGTYTLLWDGEVLKPGLFSPGSGLKVQPVY